MTLNVSPIRRFDSWSALKAIFHNTEAITTSDEFLMRISYESFSVGIVPNCSNPRKIPKYVIYNNNPELFKVFCFIKVEYKSKKYTLLPSSLLMPCFATTRCLSLQASSMFVIFVKKNGTSLFI